MPILESPPQVPAGRPVGGIDTERRSFACGVAYLSCHLLYPLSHYHSTKVSDKSERSRTGPSGQDHPVVMSDFADTGWNPTILISFSVMMKKSSIITNNSITSYGHKEHPYSTNIRHANRLN